MLNISDFHTTERHFKGRTGLVPTILYIGEENCCYYIVKAEPGFCGCELHVLNSESEACYSCSSLSVAIANIEALERGEEI